MEENGREFLENAKQVGKTVSDSTDIRTRSLSYTSSVTSSISREHLSLIRARDRFEDIYLQGELL